MKSLADRLWAKVDKSGPVPAHRPELGSCWVWTGAVTKHVGHGVIALGARAEGTAKTHRVSYELHFGPIPKDVSVELCVLHHCDNRRCVRPDHLFLGTDADNVRDMLAKGRAVFPPVRRRVPA